MRFELRTCLVLLLSVVSCAREEAEDVRRPPLAPPATAVAPDTALPQGPLGVSIRRGRALMNRTRDSLPRHVGNTLNCTSCHLDDGLRLHAMPFIGVYSRFPQYRARNGRVNVIEDRINDCFERSMNGTGLAFNGRDMRDIVAYMAFLSRGIAPPGEVAGQGTKPLATLTPGDTVFGREVFVKSCAQCHGASGEGTAVAPPLWGRNSYSIGAGMARVRTAAAFIRQAMPFDQPGSLTDAQAADVAAYINSRPRPDFRGKENDWPNGDPPPDAAYPTRVATQPPTKSSTQ